MAMSLAKAFLYTRSVTKISRQLGSDEKFDLRDKTTERAIEQMKGLWRSNELLAPLLTRYEKTEEDLADYY